MMFLQEEEANHNTIVYLEVRYLVLQAGTLALSTVLTVASSLFSFHAIDATLSLLNTSQTYSFQKKKSSSFSQAIRTQIIFAFSVMTQV